MTKNDETTQRRTIQHRHRAHSLHCSIAARTAIRCLIFCTLAAVVSSQCSVCGDGLKVGNKDAIFSFPGQPEVACDILEQAGEDGDIPLAQCAFLPDLQQLVDVCECVSINPPTDPPTPFPTLEPTPEPTSEPTFEPTPEPTPAPTSPPTEAPTRPPTEAPTSPPTEAPTPAPTEEPTRPPTRPPTEEPTPAPTPVPTSPPTEEPTRAPTPVPTSPPTEEPTRAPTPVPPTPRPSPQPTLAPTPGPTFQQIVTSAPNPTPAPTMTPTPAPTRLASSPPSNTPPTQSPTPGPTPSPSMAPTPRPTPKPTPEPTLRPTPKPTLGVLPTAAPVQTDAPTFSPSVTASSLPSMSPTIQPSTKPSPSPSMRPSLTPSIEPTASQIPSLVPTSPPTGIEPTASPAPSVSHPSAFPTWSPSSAPTPLASSMPSVSDAPSLSTQTYLIEVVMYMEGASAELKGSSEIKFQTVTASHIREEFLDDLDELTVGTNIKEQKLLSPTIRSRRLQESTLEIIFDTAVSFKYATTNLDVAALIGAAFDTEEDMSAYLRLLGQSFADISKVSVEINGIPQTVTLPESPDSPDGVDMGVIIGAVAGGIALVGLLLIVFLRKKKPVHDDNITFASSKQKPGHERVNTDVMMAKQDDISTLGDPMPGIFNPVAGIFMEPQDDISTLGDPMPANFPMPANLLGKDDTTTGSIVSGDYEYEKGYGQATSPGVHESVQGSGVDSVLGDEESFLRQFTPQVAMEEERFEIDAPAGKLGMVIDTPSGGIPVVHAIKDSSMMVEQGVRIGDQLVAIDDEDTTGLTAMQVSKLISQKADNPSRVLEFVRTIPVGVPQ